MITVRQLLRGEGKYWTRKPSSERSSIEILAWHAASQLASLVELIIEPADLHRVWPDTYQVLWGLEAYWKDVGELPPQSTALVMLMIERVNRGLSARGDDTEPPRSNH